VGSERIFLENRIIIEVLNLVEKTTGYALVVFDLLF
jgi:hypothetical protein